MKNGCMENETYRLNWVFVDKISESLFEAVANDMGKFPEKYKNVKVVERDKIIEALKNIDNYLQKIAELEQELAEFKQKAIVPKFRTYQPIFYITQFYTSTKGNPEYDIISDKYYVAENENEIILGWNYAKDFNQRKYYYVRKDWVFATREEAEQKLAEIKGE